MGSIRNVLYGYSVEKGVIVLNREEAPIVFEAFNRYCDGEILKDIADSFTERKIAYYEEGELYINDEETSHYGAAEWEKYREKYIATVFQDFNIIDNLTVLENVELALLRFDDKKIRHEKARELIEKVGLIKQINQRGSKLSGGEKQRTVIARALAKDAPIILADEPTGNLDVKSSREIAKLLKDVSKDKLVIVVTHNPEFFVEYATRRVTIFDGSVKEDKVIEKPAETKNVEVPEVKQSKKKDIKDTFHIGVLNYKSRPRFTAMMSFALLVCAVTLFVVLSVFGSSIQSFVNTVCLTVVLLVGAYFVAIGRISPGNVAAMMGYYSILNKIIGELNGLIRRLPILDNIAQRLTYFYEDAELCGEGEKLGKINELHGEKFTFCYDDNKPVFAPCSFTINKGEKVVVHGHNGSGRSTILNVLLGILQGYRGNLTVDGTELSAVEPDSYRDLIAYAPQDPYLLKGTILDNIRFANPNSDETKVRQLLQEYGISGIAEREIKSGGYELSGGERQKISIIRAMIKDTPVVFLDEPENNLDITAMKKVKEWICHSDKTIIYVSHNPELIACADKEIKLT